MSELPDTVIRRRSVVNRWLGAGLAVILSVVTIGLAATGRLGLYISPESVWFAVAGAVVTIALAVWSCVLPLGEEEDHGHDHGHADASKRALAAVVVGAGGVIASAVVVASLVLPPASLSVDLAMSRATDESTLFAGADNVALGVIDTSTFGVGEWSTAFATSTRPETYDGAPVTLVGFLTPAGENPDEVRLTRLVITHCVIDAQPAAVPVSVSGWQGEFSVGDWVEVQGTVRAEASGALVVEPESVVVIDEPGDPYEY